MPIAPPPRVIVVDNEREHLNGLVDALQRCGVSCRPLLYPEDLAECETNPHVRVIFADLNLLDGDFRVDPSSCHDAIGALITDIKPMGPYFIVLWTQHDTTGDDLKTFLGKKLEGAGPLAVATLQKADYMDLSDGHVREPSALAESIKKTIGSEPQVAALMSWEAHVMNATGNTVAEIGRLAEVVANNSDVSRGLAVLLAKLAVESVGLGNVEKDRFGAVIHALAPLLSDRLAASVVEETGTNHYQVWSAAFSDTDLSASAKLPSDVAAALNRASLVATDNLGSGDSRGAVVRLADLYPDNPLSCLFGIDESVAAQKQYRCKNYDGTRDYACEWVLVQAQAACDHAQGQPGPLPYYLGMEFPTNRDDRGGKPPGACWTSPAILRNGQCRFLRVNARFGVFVTREAVRSITPVYRLREQTINHLVHHIHAYGARPGMMSFPLPK